MNRFRPNLVLAGLEPYDEDHVDTLVAGGVTMKLVKPCTRCQITTTDQDSGEVGTEPLATLAGYRMNARLGGVTFGMNAIVVAGEGRDLTVGADVEARSRSERADGTGPMARRARRRVRPAGAPPDSRRNPPARRRQSRQREAERRLEPGGREHAIRRPARRRRIIRPSSIGTTRGRGASPTIARAKSNQLACPVARKVIEPRPLGEQPADRRRRSAPSPRPACGSSWERRSGRRRSRARPARRPAAGSSAGNSRRASRRPSSCGARARARRRRRSRARPRACSRRTHSAAPAAHPPDTAWSRVPSNT